DSATGWGHFRREVDIRENYFRGSFFGWPTAPSSIVGAKTQDCYATFHKSKVGKFAAFFSPTAMTSVEPHAKETRENQELFVVATKSWLAGLWAGSKEVGAKASKIVEEVMTPPAILFSAVDNGALAVCAAGGAASLGASW